MSGDFFLLFLRDVLRRAGLSFAQEEENQGGNESKTGETSDYASCDWPCL